MITEKNKKYLLVHSDLSIPTDPINLVTVSSPHDKARKGLYWKALQEEYSALDHDKLLSDGAKIIRDLRESLKEIQCHSIVEFGLAFKKSKEAGHKTLSCDSPYSRTLGFIDNEKNEYFKITLSDVKKASSEDWGLASLDKDSLSNYNNRTKIFSSGEDVFSAFDEYDSEETEEYQSYCSSLLEKARCEILKYGEVEEIKLDRPVR